MHELLLLHGALGSKVQMSPLEKELSGDFRVYAIDLSGHGQNPMTDEPFSIKLFAGDVLNWLDSNGKETIDIFGYSMGGYVALYLARYHPERIGKIFTLATKFEWTEESSAREVKLLDANKIKEKVPAYAEQLKRRHGEKWETVLAKTAEMMLSLGNKKELSDEDLKMINNEAIISVGDSDNMVSIDETKSAAGLLKNGKFLLLGDTPHPLEKVNLGMLQTEILSFFN